MATRKISYKLTVLAIVPVILSMIVFGSISYVIFKEQLINERIEETTSLIDLSSQEIKNPLYFLDISKLNSIIKNIKKNPNILAVYIMGPDGRVITDGTPENKFYNQILDDEFSKKSITSDGTYVEVENKVIRISTPEIINEKIGIIRIDYSLNELDRALQNLIVLLMAVGTLVILVVAAIDIFISRNISKPIINLRDASLDIAQGNFGTKIKIRSNDEIGELAEAFNKMAEDLQKSIAELKRTEEIRHENEHLIYASKLKSEFLATMSHELRTPLNAIIGFSELLKMGGGLDKKQEHYLDNVLTSSKFLLDLINEILDLSKVEAGRMELAIEKVSVPAMINETITLLKEKAAKHNINLEKDMDPELDFIEVDPQRFKQVLFNLLSNAVKFSKKEGGTVTVTSKREGNMAKFQVSDTGIGIMEEDIGKLFKAFDQLDTGISRKYGGTGLGLAISKKMVELHDGKIMAESRYGIGSTFTFILPIMAKERDRDKMTRGD
ncbi:Methyl sulfide methyltransferase-associated sensor [uncultured archaeon]|nr:Methyl sulfide methyltransferase-associated sensor [uncultured archaeon]